MTLDKSIKHGKEKRKPYYDSRAIDSSCRNNGSCPHCQKNRVKNLTSQNEIDKIVRDNIMTLNRILFIMSFLLWCLCIISGNITMSWLMIVYMLLTNEWRR